MLDDAGIARTGDALTDGTVYLWHCDRDGDSSLHSKGLENENCLRGVQEMGADGSVRLTSIFPGCCPGRRPHIHFEVDADLATAIAAGSIVKTSQIALPKEAADAGIRQLATMTGSASAGYTAALTIGV